MTPDYTATVLRAVDALLASQLAAARAFEAWNTDRTEAYWDAFLAARERARAAARYEATLITNGPSDG